MTQSPDLYALVIRLVAAQNGRLYQTMLKEGREEICPS